MHDGTRPTGPSRGRKKWMMAMGPSRGKWMMEMGLSDPSRMAKDGSDLFITILFLLILNT